MLQSLLANPALLFWSCLIGLLLTLIITEYLRPYILNGSNDPLQHSSLRLYQVTALLSGLFLAGLLLGLNGMLRMPRPQEKTATQSAPTPETSAPLPAATASTAPAVPQVVVVATATPAQPSPTPLPQALVVNTGGAGVNIRARPSTNAQIIGLAAEGSLVTLLGENAQDERFVWEHIRTPEGVEGWVVNLFLEPQQ